MSTSSLSKNDEASPKERERSLGEEYVLDDDMKVTFSYDTNLNPLNWSVRKKLAHTALFGITTWASQLNSTMMSAPEIPTIFERIFGVSREVCLLPNTFYLLGIALGPMVFAPLSEVYGRKSGVLIPFLVSGVLTFAVACSSSMAAIIIFRFLAGFFAGAPVVSSGGVLSDIWSPGQRGMALGFYAFFVANGPSFGPTIGSLLVAADDTDNAWRYPQYFCGALIVVLFLICEYACSETYAPVLLAKAAKTFRIQTGNWAIHGSHDEWQLTTSELVHVHFYRPFKMLMSPVIFVIAIYASYVFGMYYLLIAGIHELFNMTRGWTGTISTLPNISLAVGVAIGLCINIGWARVYGRMVEKNNGQPLPEERLPPMKYVGFLFPVGIFIFAWTSWASIPWVVPCIGIAIAGIGFVTIFQGCLNYLIDTYRQYAASAIAANTILRSIFAGVFPLFTTQLFENLGVHWGASLIGFIGLAMIPIPWVFYKYGRTFREKNVLVLEAH